MRKRRANRSFCNYVFCLSSLYGVWFPLWYLQIFFTGFSMYHSYYE